MKRGIVVFIVLVAALTVLLYVRLRAQRAQADRPSGGSATVEGTKVDITARLLARIRDIKVMPGQVVKKGQVLVELDCAEPMAVLAQAEAAIEGAKVALDVARTSTELSRVGIDTAKGQIWMAYAAARAAQAQKSALKAQRGAVYRASRRMEKVHRAGAASDQVLDQSTARVEGLDGQLKALSQNIHAAEAREYVATNGKKAAIIQDRLAQIRINGAAQQIKGAQAARDRAQVAVQECTLRSPRDGYVLSRNFEPGEVVMPGSRVLTLIDIREVKATFYLPNAELAAAKPGRMVSIKADAYPRRVFEGRILRVGVEAEFTPRNIQTRQDRDRLVYAVEVAVPNTDGSLRPGMPVEVIIPGTGKGAR